MALSIARRILHFNFDPAWFVHPVRLVAAGGTGARSGQPSSSGQDLAAASNLLRSFQLSGHWCFDFRKPASRLILLAPPELDWVLPQLALLALPEFRNLVVRRDDREWIRTLPAAANDSAAGVGDVFREQGEFRPASGVKDMRVALRRYGAALWFAAGQGLGEAGLARMRLMLDPTLEVPQVSIGDAQANMLHFALASVLDSRQGDWAWLRS